ncbi:glycosyltransferase [Pseudoalteromonas sp. SSDWG2]|uniref:glycosyltransferase n=1 Tax=Pseudoalteromonas sp. SSDWG2 TaxID=3139391 RepID=UPI003BAD62E7
MKVNLLVALYRDAYFHHSFGYAVRDLQFLDALASLDVVERVTIINRPVSILERALFRKPIARRIESDKINTIDQLSTDIFGALKGRGWAEDVYPSCIDQLLISEKSDSHINVFLDFLPIGCFSEKLLDGWLYWYDFIDNFKKHNRFSKTEKDLVKKKYDFAARNANFVSSVSAACLEANDLSLMKNSMVISNKVYVPKGQTSNPLKLASNAQFDFGFIGFVTDKLDVKFVEMVSERYKVAIYGKVLDGETKRQLSRLKNVTLLGAFSYSDVPAICRTFKVGLLPYLQEKSHDGSPLKLYEYMKFNIPCLTSMDYEISDTRFIRNYNCSKDIDSDIEDMLSVSGNDLISSSIRKEWHLSYCVNEALNAVVQSRV